MPVSQILAQLLEEETVILGGISHHDTARNTRIVSVLLLSALAFGLCSCGTFCSSYFQRPPDSQTVTIDVFASPRASSAARTPRTTPNASGRATFAVTAAGRQSERSYGDDYDWRQKPGAVDGLAKRFLRPVTDLFVPDSIVLHETPSEAPPVVLKLDTTNFSPRREDYLTFQVRRCLSSGPPFACAPCCTSREPGLPPTADSVVFQMWRVELEERGLLMFNERNPGLLVSP